MISCLFGVKIRVLVDQIRLAAEILVGLKSPGDKDYFTFFSKKSPITFFV